jgi:hypothetical protein
LRSKNKRSRAGAAKPRQNEGGTPMFKKFIERIIEAKNQEDAIQNVFYGPNGIDQAYQNEKISWKEHQMLLNLISKMA